MRDFVHSTSELLCDLHAASRQPSNHLLSITTQLLLRNNAIRTKMASQDDGLAAPADSRERKRQRDKQNQREKRKREQDSVDELKSRNDSLERQVKILQAGSDDAVKQLSETVEQLRARNEVLVKKLSRVSAFVKAWTEENLGDAQTDGTGHDESESWEREQQFGRRSSLTCARFNSVT